VKTLLLALAPEHIPPDTLEQIGRLAPDLRIAVTNERA
jgi:hypothetical protein